MVATATKIRLARGLSTTLLRLGFRQHRRIRRNGINFEVDLLEGIDLSLFLFGVFQPNVSRAIRHFVGQSGVVLDVGANIGALSLPAADQLRTGHVYAFEPTDFAFAKLQRNLSLNPSIASRITAINTFVADSPAPTSHLVAYSSWPLDRVDADEHPVHKGIAKSASCGQTTIDDFILSKSVERVSVIKTDTDGHDFSVLVGARRCLSTLRPVVIFEACAYLMEPPLPSFDDFAELFRAHDYTICLGKRFEPIDARLFARRCPAGGGLDLVAMPNERLQMARRP